MYSFSVLEYLVADLCGQLIKISNMKGLKTRFGQIGELLSQNPLSNQRTVDRKQ